MFEGMLYCMQRRTRISRRIINWLRLFSVIARHPSLWRFSLLDDIVLHIEHIACLMITNERKIVLVARTCGSWQVKENMGGK